MPFIESSNYLAPSRWYKNPHVSTIYLGRFKKTIPPNYQRERIELEDGDFLDVDFVLKSKETAIILCHGLEGASVRAYNNTSSQYFLEKDFSVFAWNNRSCSGEMNRLPLLYHHAVIEDVEVIVNWVLEKGFQRVYLMGFSMGGAQVMNYLGRKIIDDRIKAAVAVSTPIHLKDSAETLKKGFNKVYLKNFTRKITKKLKIKQEQYPDLIDWSKLKSIKTFDEVDEYFTAPLHGFLDKEDYYEKASPDYSMEKIKTPVLVINAWDDPFLGENCYPIDFAQKHAFVYLEIPENGGHCAFPMKNSPYSYSEIRGFEFFQNYL
jgi:predicted alpha/beta-fold hydrolase